MAACGTLEIRKRFGPSFAPGAHWIPVSSHAWSRCSEEIFLLFACTPIPARRIFPRASTPVPSRSGVMWRSASGSISPAR